jgi:hypothetical protein
MLTTEERVISRFVEAGFSSRVSVNTLDEALSVLALHHSVLVSKAEIDDFCEGLQNCRYDGNEKRLIVCISLLILQTAFWKCLRGSTFQRRALQTFLKNAKRSCFSGVSSTTVKVDMCSQSFVSVKR